MLKIEHLSFAYPRHQVMTDMSLSFPPGKIYGVLGPNGAGKSTLLYLIAGLLTPKSGQVTFMDVNTRLRLPSTLEDIFILPEEFQLPSISLEKYVRANAKFYPRFSMDDLKRHLETFEMPFDVNLGALSMGQKKGVHELRLSLQHTSASDGRTYQRPRHSGQEPLPQVHSVRHDGRPHHHHLHPSGT